MRLYFAVIAKSRDNSFIGRTFALHPDLKFPQSINASKKCHIFAALFHFTISNFMRRAYFPDVMRFVFVCLS